MGRGLRRALWLVARLVVRRVDFDAVLTTQPGHAEKIVADYEGPVDVIVAIGGDGTIQEVVNGIMSRDDKPTLAVMPAGRGNDFSHHIGIGRKKKKALRALLSDKTMKVDLLKFNDRYAGNVVGIGYDAAVQEKAGRYKYWAIIRYLITALILILKGPEPIPMRIDYEGGIWEGKYLIAVVGHTYRYARHIRIFPGLRIDGGVMKVAAIEPCSKPMALAILFSAGLGLPLDKMYSQVRMVETPWAEITVSVDTKAQSDGDLFYVGKNEILRIELVKDSLLVKDLGNKQRP